MSYFKVQLQYKKEPFEESGRVILIPKSEAATATTARSMALDLLKPEWKIHSVK